MSAVLVRALLLLLPVALYVAWRLWRRHRHERERAHRAARGGQWALFGFCALVAAVAVGLALLGSALFEGGAPGTAYHPTRVDEEGQVLPGGFTE